MGVFGGCGSFRWQPTKTGTSIKEKASQNAAARGFW